MIMTSVDDIILTIKDNFEKILSLSTNVIIDSLSLSQVRDILKYQQNILTLLDQNQHSEKSKVEYNELNRIAYNSLCLHVRGKYCSYATATSCAEDIASTAIKQFNSS